MTAGLSVVAAGAARAAASTARQALRALPGRRDEALSVVNGAIGDVVAAQASSLAIPMTLRSAGLVTRSTVSAWPIGADGHGSDLRLCPWPYEHRVDLVVSR